MKTKGNCPHCNAPVEANASQAGMAGDCPACEELLVIPSSSAALTPTPPQPTKTAEDYVADAICATADSTWKFTKFVAPVVGRVAAKIAGRATITAGKVAGRAAIVAAPHVEKAAKSTWKPVKLVKRKSRASLHEPYGRFLVARLLLCLVGND